MEIIYVKFTSWFQNYSALYMLVWFSLPVCSHYCRKGSSGEAIQVNVFLQVIERQ